MFGLSIKTTRGIREMEAEQARLQSEVKGYIEGDNRKNALINAYKTYLKNRELAPFLPISRDQIKECYETTGPLYGVVHKIARSTGEVANYLELYNKRTGDVVESHWVLDLVNRPNDRYTRQKFVEAWAINKLLYSDAWIYAPMTVGADRTCKEMFIISSGDVVVERGGVDKPLAGIKIGKSAAQELIPAEALVMSFDYNLDATSFFGTSKAVAAAKYLSVITRGMNREDTALVNGGAANLITPKSTELGIKPSDAQEIEQRVNGKESFNKTLALKVPVEVHSVGSNPAELGILEAHKEAITVLCFVYELPVDLVYGQAKYENAKEAKKAIYEMNAIPLAEEFGADILHHFALDEEFEFKVNTDEISVLQDDPGDVLDNLVKMHATLNEMRESYGYEPIEEPWANQPILPMAVQFGNEAGVDFDETENTTKRPAQEEGDEE